MSVSRFWRWGDGFLVGLCSSSRRGGQPTSGPETAEDYRRELELEKELRRDQGGLAV